MKTFLAIHFLMGVQHLSYRDYWYAQLRDEYISSLMPINKFSTNLHLADNNLLVTTLKKKCKL